MALIALDNSAWKEVPLPVFTTKQRSKSDSLFLKIPPQADRLLLDDPYVLHFIQLKGGGSQTT
jgi:hypothetical protein